MSLTCDGNTDQNERKQDPVKSKLYDARGADSKCGLKTEHIFSHTMDLKSKEPPPPFSYLLLDQEPTFVVDTVFGYMPVGSCLSYQLEDFGREPPKFFSKQSAPIDSVHHTFSAFPDIPILRDNKVFDLDHDLGVFHVSNVCREFLLNSILISVKDAISLEKRTVLQSDCLEWVNQYKVRLTASNFGKLFKRIQMPTEALLKSIFGAKDQGYVKAISHGKRTESTAKDIYAKYNMQKNVFLIFDADLCISSTYPYLGASPDGKIFDPTAADPYGLLEIKCPYRKRKEMLEQALLDPGFYLQKI
ncbi:hypothetical protein SNE40_006885 [Patella caerulea]|uniref:YqaJ viral recombinase domain-containing protein n=1 Tax=Patella caerulea TaxID=87958 RepID=A0AAN8JXD4_PATCE